MIERVKQVLADAILAEANLYIVLMAFLVFICGVVCIFFFERFKEKNKGIFKEKRQKACLYAFWFYICGLLYITLLNRASGVRCGIRKEIDLGNAFGSDVEKKVFWYSFFNVMLFVPAGFLLGRLQSKRNKLIGFVFSVAYCCAITVTVEYLQLLFRKGFFEFTDIICNITGAVLGAGIAFFPLKKKKI